MKVLVTGAAGVMGQRLVRGLFDRGHSVRCLVLPGEPLRAPLEQLGAEIREGNVSDAASLAGLCDGVDTVQLGEFGDVRVFGPGTEHGDSSADHSHAEQTTPAGS